MIIVSGCPRSGTSLMMDILRDVFGNKRILGQKFPQEFEPEKKHPFENEAQYNVRQYIFKKLGYDKQHQETIKMMKDMNPNGFWEMPYTTKGVRYRFGDIERLESLLKEEKKSICNNRLLKKPLLCQRNIVFLCIHFSTFFGMI